MATKPSNVRAESPNMRQGYWFYAVYDCAAPSPRLIRLQDPFCNLLARAKRVCSSARTD